MLAVVELYLRDDSGLGGRFTGLCRPDRSRYPGSVGSDVAVP